MPAPTMTTEAAPGWLEQPVQLAPRVSLVAGADDHPLLYNAETGVYVRLSRTGARMVPLLDGTRTGTALLAAASRSRGPDGVRDRSPDLLSFLNDLRAAGVLSEPPEPPHGVRLLFAYLFRLAPEFRIPAGFLNRLLGPPARILARFRTPFSALAVLLAAAAVAAVALAMTRPAPITFAGPPWLLIGAVFLVQAAVHESAHATVCQALGVPVREAGVKLFLLLIPLTFVDRTDAYRVRSRSGRAVLALAGPLVDLVATGLTSLLIIVDPAHTGGLRWLLGMQLFLVCNNLNPLLPVTDGHHALEAALGEINLRHRAFTYLGHVLFRIPLSSAHQSVSAGRRSMYLAYGIISAVYVGVVLTLIAMNYYTLIETVTG
jgi:putative peptide zinc metalloprotease protein